MNSNSQQPRPSIRIGSSPAQRRILEEETGPSSSPLTTDPASMLPSSVEASALPEATLPEGSIPKEDSSLPEDSVPMEGSSPPRDSVPVEGDNPPKDSIPSEGRSPSLVSYDDEDVEDSVAPLPPSHLRASEVPPSPLPERKTVQPSLATKEGLEDQPSASPTKAIEVPSSSLSSSSEVPPSHSQQLLPPVPTVRRTIQNPAVPTSGSPLTSSTVSGVNNLSVSPPQARDSTPNTPNFPSHLSEEQRKRYELLFSDLVDYEKPPREFSHMAQPPAPSMEPVPEIDRETGEVSKKYLERYFQEERIWKLKNRLDRELQARRGTSSTPAHHQPLHSVTVPLYSGSYASNSTQRLTSDLRDSRVNPNDPEAIPPTEMSKGHPPFLEPSFENELGIRVTPRIGPYLAFERIEPENARVDPKPSFEPRPGVRYMRTTREGVFRRFAGDEDNLFINEANPCPYPRFSPGYNASLDILIDRDHRTGWWFTETTYQERLFLYDTTIPQVYGTLLTDSAWTLNMRFRFSIRPDNLPHNTICKCSRKITITHLLNCKPFITFRSKGNDTSHRIESFLDPLLSNVFDAENDFHKNTRGDVILHGLDGNFILVDVMSVDPCNVSKERLANSEIHNPLSNAEKFKIKKYNEPLAKLSTQQHSLLNSLAPTAIRFLADFEMIVRRRTNRNFNSLF
ncbi:hypothetical protein P9112_011365 [Eukaryota sp. TZLM1-RC]